MHQPLRYSSTFLTYLALALLPACAGDDDPEPSGDDDSANEDAGGSAADDDAADDDAADDDAADDDAADDDAADDDAADDDAADDDAGVLDAGAPPPRADAAASLTDAAVPTDDAGDLPSESDAGQTDAGSAPAEELHLSELGVFEPPSGSAEGIAVDGDRVYLASTSAGVYVVDVSDPSAPSLLGQYDFPTGQLAHRVAVDGSRLAVGLRGSGWALLDVSDPAAITLLASDDGVDAADVALAGDTLYYLNANGPSSVDVSDLENPLPLTTDLVLPGADDSLLLSGSHLYVTQNGAGFSIVDASDPSALSELSSVEVGSGGNDLVLLGSSLFVAHADGIQVFDASDASDPVPLGEFARERAHLVVSAHERLIVLGDDTSTVDVPFAEIIDARDPAMLASQVESYDWYEDPVAAAVGEGLLFVSVGDDDSLHVFGMELVP